MLLQNIHSYIFIWLSMRVKEYKLVDIKAIIRNEIYKTVIVLTCPHKLLICMPLHNKSII